MLRSVATSTLPLVETLVSTALSGSFFTLRRGSAASTESPFWESFWTLGEGSWTSTDSPLATMLGRHPFEILTRICIEILTRPPLLFLNEPTSGLDSAASYHVMSRIIKLAEKDRRTVIASIHQPRSEVFELFHNLCLLSYGPLVYFCPTSSANSFFADSGFPCPNFRNTSDHFLRTINNDFDLNNQDDIESRTAARSRVDDNINLLIKAYEFSKPISKFKIESA
ncbi:hypothetical protein Droror1_Dr00021890 [Drosera rotundifolia]